MQKCIPVLNIIIGRVLWCCHGVLWRPLECHGRFKGQQS